LSDDLASLLGHLVYDNEDVLVTADDLLALLASKGLARVASSAGLDGELDAAAPVHRVLRLSAPPPPASEIAAKSVLGGIQDIPPDVDGTPPATPLLKLAEELPDVFRIFVLRRLGSNQRALLALTAKPFFAAVLAANLPRHGLYWNSFVSSAELLRWAKERGCKWDESMSAKIAQGGNLEALRWARENGCPWDVRTCAIGR
jgi:hypothetical protein